MSEWLENGMKEMKGDLDDSVATEEAERMSWQAGRHVNRISGAQRNQHALH